MPFLFRAISCAVLFLAWGTAPLLGPPHLLQGAPRRDDAEQDLLARLERERDPVRKAKYQIRLGRLKLLQSIDAYDRGDLEQCRGLLGAYLERMKSSWETLKSSGRQAVRHPQGFKELDIALREDERTIEDLKRRVPYLERTPIEKTAHEVEQLHGEVFRALFPAEQPREPGRRSPHQGRARCLLRGVET